MELKMYISIIENSKAKKCTNRNSAQKSIRNNCVCLIIIVIIKITTKRVYFIVFEKLSDSINNNYQ